MTYTARRSNRRPTRVHRAAVQRWRRPRIGGAASTAPWSCTLYRIYVLDPRTDFTTETLGYIGETGRGDATIRLREHQEDQPWGDTITRFVMEPDAYQSKAQVRAAERHAIVTEQPLYNIDHNEANPNRIMPWDAAAARDARDTARGIPPEQTWRARQRAATTRTVRARKWLRRWSRTARGRRTIAVMVWWLPLWPAAWTAIGATLPLLWWRDAILAAAVAGLFLTWVNRPRLRRREAWWMSWPATRNLAIRLVWAVVGVLALFWPYLIR